MASVVWRETQKTRSGGKGQVIYLGRQYQWDMVSKVPFARFLALVHHAIEQHVQLHHTLVAAGDVRDRVLH